MAASTASMCWRSEGDRVCSRIRARASARFTRSLLREPRGMAPELVYPDGRRVYVPTFRPQLGDQNRPELAGVVTAPCPVFRQEPRRGRAREQPWLRQTAVGERGEPRVEPARDRHRQAALLAADDVVRHQPPRGFL